MTTNKTGILLEDLIWQQAEEFLTAESVIVLPLGVALKEHGPHLKLNNDFILAEYLKNKILEQAEVMVLPTVNGERSAYRRNTGRRNLKRYSRA